MGTYAGAVVRSHSRQGQQRQSGQRFDGARRRKRKLCACVFRQHRTGNRSKSESDIEWANNGAWFRVTMSVNFEYWHRR